MANRQLGVAASRNEDVMTRAEVLAFVEAASISPTATLHDFKTMSMWDIAAATATALTVANATYAIKMYAHAALTLSKAFWWVGTAGAGAAGFYTALYGPTGTLLAGSGSANVGALFNAQGGITTTFPTTTVQKGIFYLGFKAGTATTQPTLRVHPQTASTLLNANLPNGVASATAPRFATAANTWATATPPATLGTLTQSGLGWAIGLS